MAMRTRGLGGYLPSGFGYDLTNMYAMTNSTAMRMGEITSENRTVRTPARGTSRRASLKDVRVSSSCNL